MEGCHFWTVTCGLVTTGIWKGEGRDGSPFSGCVKSETGKKKVKRQNRWHSITCPTRCNGRQKRRQKRRFLAAIVPRCSILLKNSPVHTHHLPRSMEARSPAEPLARVWLLLRRIHEFISSTVNPRSCVSVGRHFSFRYCTSIVSREMR
jgi:hypothetical protein